jgi:prolyl-tRNA synthetase
VIADETLREGQYVVGANRDDVHLRGVQAGRDFEARFADLREVREGDACPRCGGHLLYRRRSKWDTSSSSRRGTRTAEATFVDEDGPERR